MPENPLRLSVSATIFRSVRLCAVLPGVSYRSQNRAFVGSGISWCTVCTVPPIYKSQTLFVQIEKQGR